MQHKLILLSCVALAFAGFFSTARIDADKAVKNDKPHLNIVFFLVDDLGWRDVGYNGSTYYQTPNIDKLASEGMRFTDGYAASALCSPTRAAILTGKHPARLMFTDWIPNGRWNPKSQLKSARFLRSLPLEEYTLAEALREGGYRTASIGKWNVGGRPFSLPQHHGFDINIGGSIHGATSNYFYPYNSRWLIPTTKLYDEWNILPDGEKGEYLTDRLTDEAIKFMRENRDHPFFLYLPHYAVHAPFQAKPEMVAKYKAIPEAQRQGDPTYAAMVESVDQSLGRVMDALKELGIEDNTLVIFTSDNGGFYNATDNSPLRGNKGSYYEGGIRVPVVVRWPGVTKPGSVCSEPVTSMDFYPTCLDAAGLPMRPHQHLDGQDLKPLLAGAKSLDSPAVFWHFPHYNGHPHSHPSSVIRRGDWKFIENFDPQYNELYNLADDLSETSNLVEQRKDIAEQLGKELNAWRQAVGAEMMEPNPDYDPSAKGIVNPHVRKKKK